MNVQISRKQVMPAQELENVVSRIVSEEQLNALVSRNPIFCADKTIHYNTDGGYVIISDIK
tara:strand:- start:189 stop:371 length:183 start_codon:yes stop_codon:yes gene_type:complete